MNNQTSDQNEAALSAIRVGICMAQDALAGEDTVEWARNAKSSTINLAYAMRLLDDLLESYE